MHFRLFLVVILLCLATAATAQTIVPDGAQVSGNWTNAGSPYLIQGQAIIAQDAALRIEAGVQVRFTTGLHDDYLDPQFDLGFLRVDGKLVVQGEAERPVRFTRDGAAGHWGLLYFSASADSASILSYSIIEYGSQIQHLESWMSFSGAVSLNGTALTIQNCRLQGNAYDGIEGQNARLQIGNTLVASNGASGLLMMNDCHVQLTNTTVADNGQDGVNSGYNSSLIITNSIFYNNMRSLPDNLLTTSEISYSLLQEKALPQGAQNLGGNLLGQNPQLKPDFTLRSNSFCINSGTPDTTGLHLPSRDAEGKGRLAHGRIDMGAFEFAGDYLRLIVPNGQESWKIGTLQTIRWRSNRPTIAIDYSADDGLNWHSVSASTVNDGEYEWPVPEIFSEQCLLRVSAADSAALNDQSDSTFIISDVTIIPDGAQVFGTWSEEYAPYVVRGRAVVPEDSTLTIEPGVEVRFATGSQHAYNALDFDMGALKVDGQLLALGQPEDSIRFGRDGHEGYWGVVFLNENSQPQSVFDYVKMEYASYCDSLADSLRFSGALSLYGVSPRITHCLIRNNSHDGIQISAKSSPQVAENTISANGRHGILLLAAAGMSQPLIESNRIINNTQDGLHIDGTFYTQIKNNKLNDNGKRGLYNYSGYATTKVTNNFIENNQTGIQSPGFIEITGNLLAYNNRGVDLQNLSPQIMNNTFVRQSSEAIYCNAASPYVTNCIFNGNMRDFAFVSQNASQPTLSYSLTDKSYLDGNVLNGGFVLLNRDAVFEGSAEQPFALKSSSPAVDRGTNENQTVVLPESDLAGKPRIYDGDNDGVAQVDMGAYEFSALTADFTADVVLGLKPLTVRFTNQSFGQVDSLLWCFGDGDSSRQENPLHVYRQAGLYSVSLLVYGPLGQSEKVRTNYIVVDTAPQVVRPIPDLSIAEDSGEWFTAYLSEVFADADSNDVLSYGILIDDSHIYSRIDRDTLWLGAAENYFGDVQIIAQATDSYGYLVADTFTVRVRPLNDTPRISGLPDSLILQADSGAVLSMWDYADDMESADSLLHYSFELDSDSLAYEYTAVNGRLKIWAAAGFSGLACLRLTVSDDSGAVATDSVKLKVERLTGVVEQTLSVKRFYLFQNYPNPFNSVTQIRYQLGRTAKVKLIVYNLLGQVVREAVNQKQRAGVHRLSLYMNGLPAGVYLYRLQVGKHFRQTKKLLLLK